MPGRWFSVLKKAPEGRDKTGLNDTDTASLKDVGMAISIGGMHEVNIQMSK